MAAFFKVAHSVMSPSTQGEAIYCNLPEKVMY